MKPALITVSVSAPSGNDVIRNRPSLSERRRCVILLRPKDTVAFTMAPGTGDSSSAAITLPVTPLNRWANGRWLT
jgi:hypothetical protein